MPLFGMSYKFNAKATKKLPSLLVFHCFGVVQLIISLAYNIFISGIGTEILFSRDPVNGFFGWTNPQFIWISLFLIVPISGILGVGSYIFMLDFFPPHITAGIFLLEPFSCQVIGVLFGQDNPPYVTTYIGTLIITIGLGATINGNLQNQKKQESNNEEFELSEKSVVANLINSA
mmetsp:Transcript_13391/g.11887  ORF Transcript_13391/g.11887 Transcript_13391/m.11887 type:complete len:175 (-) Transcript_13391:20-544(-)